LGVLLKIAIFHDFFDQLGGAENIALQLAKELNADIITTISDVKKIEKLGFQEKNIIEMGLFSRKTPFKQFFTALKFWFCDYSKKYDFFIFNGRFSLFAAHHHKPNIYICADIFREYYDLEKFYNKKLGVILKTMHLFGGFLFKPFLKNQFKHIEKTISISQNNKAKIKKYYNLDSEIIYPPINCEKYKWKKNKEYWLSVNRLYPAKRIELQLKAFQKLPEKKLIIVTDYAIGDESLGYVKKLEKMKLSNVEFVLRPTHKELLNFYSECEGFLATSKEEAFGMAVVEAMACGKPIVAVNEGGFKETVLNNETGFLVDADPEKIIEAIKKISKEPEKFKENCKKQALKFDSKKFFEKIRKLIESRIENSKNRME